MRKFSFLLLALLLPACAGISPAERRRAGALDRPNQAGATSPTANAATPPASQAPSSGPALSVEVEGSSRDETRRPFLLSLASKAAPTLREDEALRMVSAALVEEGYRAAPIPLGANAAGDALKITARFSKESSGFGFFGGPRHAVHLEAYGGSRLVWEYHASAVGEQDDIRPILPTLLAAGRGLIGGSTAGKRTISIALEAPNPRPAPSAETLPAPAKKSARRGLLQR